VSAAAKVGASKHSKLNPQPGLMNPGWGLSYCGPFSSWSILKCRSSSELSSGNGHFMKPFALLGVPGMWSQRNTLLPALQSLAEIGGWHCDVITLPGHETGECDLELGRRSISAYRKYVLAELTVRAATHRLIVVGHSMGGLLALMAAEAGLASALILLAPAAPKGISTLSVSWPMTSLLLEVSLHQTKGGFSPWGKGFIPSEKLFGKLLANGLAPEIQRRVFELLVPESVRALNENLSAPGVALVTGRPFSTTHPRKVNLSAITCPVFIAVGTEDKITPPSISEGISRGLKNSARKLLRVENACHWIFEENSWSSGSNESHHVRDKIVTWIQREVLSGGPPSHTGLHRRR
jgi:pimeloyl-ACP methyl ester carboxylesterase